MSTEQTSHAPEVQPDLASIEAQAQPLRLGMVGNYADTEETRIFLTPEACGMLTSAGMHIEMEADAGIDVSFSDEQYSEYGVVITDRERALGADIVLSYRPLRVPDIERMRPGATLFCMMTSELFEKPVIEALLNRNITLGTFDNMLSFNDEPVFANIIDEVNGRAAVMYAEEALSFLGEGKGVLLAGVGGINPCEVLVIGAGTVAHSAAMAALNVGAIVTLMDNDISELQVARQICGDRLQIAAIHPRVLYNKVKSADVILLGSCTRSFEMPKKLSVAMKESVYMLDFAKSEPSVSVPRTVAMALSSVLVNFFEELMIKNGVEAMIASTYGVQCGIVTYHGKLVDKLIGSYTGLPSADINMMLAGAN